MFDLPALKRLLGRLRARELDLVDVETATASPFASSLLFDYIATYMYEDDTPPAERRAQALSLDRDLLRELLGQEELRELIDPAALAEVEASLQPKPRNAEELYDLLRLRGHQLEYDPGFAETLVRERRAFRFGDALAAAEDAGRYRDALGVVPPSGLPGVFLEPVPDALRSLVARWARGRGPFTTARGRAPSGRRASGARRAPAQGTHPPGRTEAPPGASRCDPRLRERVVEARRSRASVSAKCFELVAQKRLVEPSAFAACSWRSTSSTASASNRSRSSSCPSNSRSRSRSSDSACARRSRRRRVVLVHVGRDVVEEERGRVRRRALRLDLDEIDLARLQRLQQAAQRGQVEHVLQALAVGLEDDREAAVLSRHLQERLRLQALLPERRALTRPAAGSAASVPRSHGSARRRAPSPHLGDDEILHLARVDSTRRSAGTSDSGKCNAIPSSDQIDCASTPRASRRRTAIAIAHGACDAPAERRKNADAPVADLVAEPLDDDRAIGWDRAGRLSVRGGRRRGSAPPARRGRAPWGRAPRVARARTCRSPRRGVRPPDSLALPEGNRARDARRRRRARGRA